MNTSNRVASVNATEACNFEFPDNQEKSYRKTEFILHSKVAELTADLISRVFYNDDFSSNSESDFNSPWSITPQHLRDVALTNILQEDNNADSSPLYSRYPIYGSAIAFEPGIWDVTEGLENGVTYPTASEACIDDVTYCTDDIENNKNISTKALTKNSDDRAIYCPYAYRGPPEEKIFANCSRATPRYCPSMDLSRAYDYSNVSDRRAEWYAAPRCLFLRDGIRSGYWTAPYYDDGAGGINMVTYSQPIISQRGKFLGICTIDIEVDALCYGAEQCGVAVDYNYVSDPIRIVGLTFSAFSMALSVCCAMWTFCNRRNRVVKSSQPLFLALICVGCFIMASSIIPLSIDDSIASVEGCSKACMAFPWLLSIGFSLTFSALFSKIWRLNRLFRAAASLGRVEVTEMDVIMPFTILMTCNFVLLLLWTHNAPLVWVRTLPNDSNDSYGFCSSSHESWKIFLALILAVNFLALLLANVQAFKARRISTDFSESSYVMLATASLFQALLFGVPILFLVADSAQARDFIWSSLIFVVCNTVLGLMFVPKMMLAKQQRADVIRSTVSRTTEKRSFQLFGDDNLSSIVSVNQSVMTGTF